MFGGSARATSFLKAAARILRFAFSKTFFSPFVSFPQHQLAPIKIASSLFGNKKIAKVAVGEKHSAVATVDGEILTWGEVRICTLSLLS